MKIKYLFLIMILCSVSCLSKQKNSQLLKPWSKGAFETGKYRNLFAEAGYSQQEIDSKLKKYSIIYLKVLTKSISRQETLLLISLI